jgi:hypothetical protein
MPHGLAGHSFLDALQLLTGLRERGKELVWRHLAEPDLVCMWQVSGVLVV